MDDKQTTLDLFSDEFNVLDEIEELTSDIENFEVDGELVDDANGDNFHLDTIVSNDTQDLLGGTPLTEEEKIRQMNELDKQIIELGKQVNVTIDEQEPTETNEIDHNVTISAEQLNNSNDLFSPTTVEDSPQIEFSPTANTEDVVSPQIEFSPTANTEDVVSPQIEFSPTANTEDVVSPQIEFSPTANTEEVVSPQIEFSPTANTEEVVSPQIEFSPTANTEDVVSPQIEFSPTTNTVSEDISTTQPIIEFGDDFDSNQAQIQLDASEFTQPLFNLETSDQIIEMGGLDATPVEEIQIPIEEEINIINEVEYGRVNIMVIGIGGCGCNAVNRMHNEQFEEIKLVAIDTSQQTLDNISADYKMLIGEDDLHGHGSGGNTLKSEKAFTDSKDKIRQMLRGIDMVFLAGGIGRGTGSVGLVEVGKIAREMDILTIGFATLPREMEANGEIVSKYYPQFIESVDSNIVVENEKISKIAVGLPIVEAMRLADSMLVEGIRGIFELITKPGKINLDYADIRTAFSGQGSCIMGIGKGKGEDAVLRAIQESIHSDIANVESVKNAKTIIFNITCSPRSVTIDEASRGSDLIYSFGHRDNIEHLLFGYSYDEDLDDEVKVTFIATGTTAAELGYDVFNEKPKTFAFKPNTGQREKKNVFQDIKSTSTIEEKVVSDSNEIDIPDFFKN